MKISHNEQIITPEIGTLLAGYYSDDVSTEVLDDLKLSVLLMDDGENTGAVLAFDLLGLDENVTIKIAADAGEIIGCPPENVIITCSHTHSGPHTRSSAANPINQDYIDKLYEMVKDGVRGAMDKWQEVDVFFHSSQCDQNLNRRLVDNANYGKGLPGNRWMEKIADGFKDQELGEIIFAVPGKAKPIGVMVNFAAHPLAAHAMGSGSFRISADFPGVLRDIMERDSCWCVFTQGAAGDLFPKDSECGVEGAANCAKGLALEVMRSFCDAVRHPEIYRMNDPKIRASIEKVPVDLRRDKLENGHLPPLYAGMSQISVRLHLFALGDVCLIGVPGELLAELGQEMKWHSPFRKTFILYNSTAYLSYICHANSFIPGGYEPRTSFLKPYEGLKIVVAAVEGMRKLHEPFAEEL